MQVSALVPREPVEVVGIVASTGGPPAIAQILEGISEAFPVPILVVQHMGAGFLAGFADWLGSATDRDVRLARDGEVAEGSRERWSPAGSRRRCCSPMGHRRVPTLAGTFARARGACACGMPSRAHKVGTQARV